MLTTALKPVQQHKNIQRETQQYMCSLLGGIKQYKQQCALYSPEQAVSNSIIFTGFIRKRLELDSQVTIFVVVYNR